MVPTLQQILIVEVDAVNLRTGAGIDNPAGAWALKGDELEAIGICMTASDGGQWHGVRSFNIRYFHPSTVPGERPLWVNDWTVGGEACQ